MRPARPQKEAGRRTEPPVSLQREAMAEWEETEAQEPPEEPPGERRGEEENRGATKTAEPAFPVARNALD